MPSATDFLASPTRYARFFIYGPAKTKKTWWACAAAYHGYDVLLLDADRGASILRHFSDTAQSRIHILPIADDSTTPVAFEFLTRWARERFHGFFHDQRRVFLDRPQPGATLYSLRAASPNLIVVIDSWSSFVTSAVQEFSNRNNVDPADAGKIEWDGYRWAGMMATWLVEMYKSLPCHLVIIGHQTTHEKWKGKGRDRVCYYSKETPLSTSNPHSKTLPKHFDEFYRFDLRGKEHYIIPNGDENHEGGSRTIAPGLYKWDDLQLVDVLRLQGIPPVDGSTPPREYPVVANTQPLIEEGMAPALTHSSVSSDAPVIRPAAPSLATGIAIPDTPPTLKIGGLSL